MRKYLLSGLCAIVLTFSPTHLTKAGEHFSPIPFSIILPEGERIGFINPVQNTWEIAPSYIEAHPFQADYFTPTWVKVPGKGYTLVTHQGLQRFDPLPFEEVFPPSEGLARFRLNGLYGYLSVSDGSFVIAPQYEQARDFSEGLAAVEYKMNRWKFIDSDNKAAFPNEITFAYSYKNGLVVVQQRGDGLYGLIDKKARWVFPPRYGAMSPSYKGTALVGHVEVKYKKYLDYFEFVHSDGVRHDPNKFQEIGFFSEDIASVKMNDKWGYVDTQGKWVIEPRFEEVQEFTTPNIAAAKLDGLWGIVQKDGSWLISPTWKTEPDLTLYTGGRYETGDSSQNILAPIIRVDGYLLNEKGEKLPHYVNSMLDGKVALHSGNKASAIAAFEQALTYIPNDQGALFGIKQANAL